MPTFKAFKRACSSSSAACFSLSSTLVSDRPVLAREETALERVVALGKVDRRKPGSYTDDTTEKDAQQSSALFYSNL